MSKTTSQPRKPMQGHGPGGMIMHGEKAKDFKGTFKKLVRYMGTYKFSLITVLIFAVASTVFSILGPKILGKATNALFTGIMSKVTGTGGGIDFGYIANIMLWLIGLYLISTLFSYVQGYIMTGISMKVTYQLRREIAAKIQKLPFQYYDSTSNGEVLSHITNDVDAISQSLNQSVTQIITSVTTIIGILIMMLSISWQMTLVALCIIPASMTFILTILRKSQKHFIAQQTFLGHVNGHIEEMYSSHVVVKAFNGEAESAKTFDSFNDTLYTSAWKSQFMSGMMMPVMSFIGNLGYVGVCILGGYLAANGRISVGDIQAFIQYVRQFTQPMTQVANISNVLQQTAAAAERVFAFLEQPEEVPESSSPISVNTGHGPDTELNVHIQGSVQFAHVHFGYHPDKIIVNDFSANIRPGQKVAIVGPTGAGKTTMVKLLMRFYDVNEGAILVDGYDIRDFRRNDLRSLFGMVLQDTWLYNASIADNIRYGRLDATDEEVIAAAKAAQVHHFVRTLPDGYNMILNEDTSNVSQGQKQLLTIARVILADPQILILDEATSSVDTRTEILIQKAMDNLMKGRTSFVIAHRLSTIRDADLILVMKDGDIVEQGNHEELLGKNGFYANLYNSQFVKPEALEAGV
ncbi:ABC transporter ATP-binding protein [Caproiciproducens faecalis]|uniref:ABC transporter ATP-binding protein n=1 Tax=Caproiciproducens faecalis TaxID=2820301 RepID=A0ABS7DKR6_9FIRM|nr:ABC transporter ATP-binding protein [Caproiciproducens faecalis]MBW7571709.1 ABC transporter ATP-binding protein [Caproiciproducens faecalis]